MLSQELLAKNLSFHLKVSSARSNFQDVYEYAVLPAGKLFRPLLLAASYQEVLGLKSMLTQLQDPYSDLSLVCSSVEIHHAYTLVHDDLPCMDNDDMRRGRASTHIKFGQWQALLAGDGLHAISYQLLSKVKSPYLPLIFRLMGHALGAKGLIEGQALDCSGTMKEDFKTLRRTHLLKTARLIQYSLLTGHIIATKPDFRTCLDLTRLGETLGVAFQLIDDLSELSEPLTNHEQEINPWLNFKDQSFAETISLVSKAIKLLESRPALKEVFSVYAEAMLNIINKNQSLVAKQIDNENYLKRTISLLELLCASQKS
jgi:geranylgeranyl pyrophosphate synthase